MYKYVYIYTYKEKENHIFIIDSSIDGKLGCLHIFNIVNSAAMNIMVHISFLIILLSGYRLSEIVGSYGNSDF